MSTSHTAAMVASISAEASSRMVTSCPASSIGDQPQKEEALALLGYLLAPLDRVELTALRRAPKQSIPGDAVERWRPQPIRQSRRPAQRSRELIGRADRQPGPSRIHGA